MFRILPVNEIAARKKMLVAQSDVQRQTLMLQAVTMEHQFAHFKKRFAIFGLSSVALSAGASIAGLIFAKRKAAEPATGGLMSKIFSGFSLFNQLRHLFTRFKGTTVRANESAEF